MQRNTAFEVQGHRGARGLAPENTLPSFEIALDVGASSLETDVHLTSDDVVVVFHDACLTDRICSSVVESAAPAIAEKPMVRSLSREQLRAYRVNPITAIPPPIPLTLQFCRQHKLHTHGIPTLCELFEFVRDYAGYPGEQVGKTSLQREQARRVIFDIELKRMPFHPQTIGDGFTGLGPKVLEHRVVDAIRQANVLERTRIRSFDHRSVRAIKQLEPSLQTGLLIHYTAPAHVDVLLTTARADIYCPDYHFVDVTVVQQVHEVGKRIIPYTVNEPAEWEPLLEWGVDGITTDFPDRLRLWLMEHDILEQVPSTAKKSPHGLA